MKFDFETVYERKGKDALAVDGVFSGQSRHAPTAPEDGFEFIPMWVADMNFAASPAVLQEINQRLAHPLFGYFRPREDYIQAILDWQKQSFSVNDLSKAEILHFNGVHGFICSALEVFSRPQDKILIHTPVYTGFLKDLAGKQRIPVFSPLEQDSNGIWRMNYEDMDRKLQENDIHLVIFCSPHNPTGRVWERWELEKAAAVFKKNNCLVISDEIWSDLVFSPSYHIPLAQISPWARQNTLAAYSPSKAFNLAGMNSAYALIYNPQLRSRLQSWVDSGHLNSIHLLSMYALIGAYSSQSQQWLAELLQVLEKNVSYACTFIQDRFDGVRTVKPESTYLLLLDCQGYCRKNKISLDALLKKGWDVGVGWQDGRPFQAEYGIRMNLALPYRQVKEALNQLDQYVFPSE